MPMSKRTKRRTKVRLDVELSGCVELEVDAESLQKLKAGTDVDLEDIGIDWTELMNQVTGTASLME